MLTFIIILVVGVLVYVKFIKPNIVNSNGNDEQLQAKEPAIDNQEEIKDNPIPYRKGNRWGYCDKNKKIVIPIRFEEAYPFSRKSGGLALVMVNNKYGFIDTKGNMVIPAIYDDAGYFSDGLAYVKVNDKFGFIDTKGNMVIPAIYDYADDFFEGLTYVKVNDERGYIDKRGVQYWED